VRSLIKEIFTWSKTFFHEKRRWRQFDSLESSRTPRVYYGYDSIPTKKEIAFGGMVKTQDLMHVFPNSFSRPNLLYLISSALPPYAPRMARFARNAGAQVVLNQNGVAYPAWHGEGWNTTNRFMAEVLEQASYVFYQSNFCKISADRYLQKRNDNCEVLYNPVDTYFFCPSQQIPPLNPVRLLLAGSHHHFYRVQSAVDTLQLLRKSGLDAKLEIAGRYCWSIDPESAKNELMQYIVSRSLSDHVFLSGSYTQEEGCLMFQRSHILLHTKFNDPCPRLVVEGMASGLPVVYSASGGTPELVGENAGVGIPAPLDWEEDHPPSAELLAEGVKIVLRSYERYTISARTRAVERFDVKPWLAKHQDIFCRLTKGVLDA
jgi:glycosyltransferase involved in cell wall biosynthesis